MSGIRLEDNAAQLVRESWDLRLQDESQERDILTEVAGTYNPKDNSVPNGIVMNVDLKGVNNMQIGLLMDLTAAGTQGDGTVTTEAQVLKYFNTYAANVRHGVPNDMFGREANLLEPYDMLGRATGQIAKWMKAREGKHARQACVQRISDNLVLAPNSLTAGLNRHINIKNLTNAQQPAYSATLNTYTSNVYTALGTAGTSSAAYLTPQYLTRIPYYAASIYKIKPMNDGTYILLTGSRNLQNLMNLGDTTSLASLQRTALSTKYAEQAFMQSPGQVGSVVLIEDPRYPILVRDTADTSVRAYYRDVGDTDDRNSYTISGTTTVYDVDILLGKGGLTKSTAMKLRFDEDYSDVGRIRELVASQTYGYQVTEFDNDSQTATSRIGQNCALFVSCAGTLTT